MLDEGLADPVCSAAVTELSMSERHFDDVAAYIDGCLARGTKTATTGAGRTDRTAEDRPNGTARRKKLSV